MKRTTLLLICWLYSLGATASPTQETLRIGIPAPLPSQPPHPLLPPSNAIRNYLLHLSQRPVFSLSPASKIQCRLCQETQLQLNPENSLNITLQSKLSWGDGTAVSSRDLILAWEIGKSQGQLPYSQIIEIREINQAPLQLQLSFQAGALVWNSLHRLFMIPAHIEQAAWQQANENPSRYFQQTSLYVRRPQNPGLYLGPYLPTAKPGHYQKAPTSKAAIAEIQLQALSQNQDDSSLHLIPELTGPGSSDPCRPPNCLLQQQIADTNAFVQMSLNMQNPILRDRRVRQALAYGLNREELLALSADASPAMAPFHPQHPNFTHLDVAYYSFTPKKTNQLLKAAGWKIGTPTQISSDTPLVWEKNHKKLTLPLLYPQHWQAQALLIQKQLAKLGIEIKLERLSQLKQLQKRIKRRNFRALALYGWYTPHSSSFRGYYHSEAIPSIYNHYSGGNYSSWRVQELDHRIEALEKNPSLEKLRAHALNLQRLYSRELPAIPLYFRAQRAWVHPRLLNFQMVAENHSPSSAWCEDWRLQPTTAVTPGS